MRAPVYHEQPASVFHNPYEQGQSLTEKSMNLSTTSFRMPKGTFDEQEWIGQTYQGDTNRMTTRRLVGSLFGNTNFDMTQRSAMAASMRQTHRDLTSRTKKQSERPKSQLRERHEKCLQRTDPYAELIERFYGKQ